MVKMKGRGFIAKSHLDEDNYHCYSKDQIDSIRVVTYDQQNKAKLDKIEGEYKSGKLTDAEAKANIQKVFYRAQKAF